MTDLEAFAIALARLLPNRGDKARLAQSLDIAPQTVSGYVSGDRTPSVETVSHIESHLGVDPGTLTVHLGYLPLSARDLVLTSSEEAIIADPRLDGTQKRLLLGTLDQLIAAREPTSQQQR